MVGLFGQTYSGIFYIPINTRDALFFGLFYVTLGCFFSFHIERIRQLNSRVKSKTLFTFFLLSCIFQMIESLVTVKWLNGTKGGIGYYVSTIPLSISLFMLILKNKGFGNQSILSRIGKNSLGIYVSHMLFISFSIWVIRFFNLQRLIGNIGFILFLTVFVFVFSHYFYIFTQSLKGRFNNWILIKIQSILLLPRIKSNQDKVKNQMVNKN
jgi:peptidoglycan/LPS O-acetylase OafA/YrhL